MQRNLSSLGLIAALLCPGSAGAQLARLPVLRQSALLGTNTSPVPGAPAVGLVPVTGAVPALQLAPTLAPAIAPALAVPALAAQPVAAAPATAERPAPVPQLRAAASAGAAPASFDGSSQPRIAVIGGGISGLTAVHELAKLGLSARLFEADTRLGGRVRSVAREGTALKMDEGAEFVSTTHLSLLGLMKEFGIQTLPRPSIKMPRSFFYKGKAYEGDAFQRKVFREAGPQLRRIVRDNRELRRALKNGRMDVVQRYDSRSLGAYLDELKAPEILRAFLGAVIDSESGRDHRELSSVVLFECLAIFPKQKKFSILPDEDEVFRVAGGAGTIIAALEARHGASASLSHRLTAVDSADAKTYALTFETPEGPKTFDADYVVMALPMTALKHVAIAMPGWTPALKSAVDGVEFGGHQKLSLLFSRRIWLESGHSGEGFNDAGYQFWDSSEGQPGEAGSITFFGRTSDQTPGRQAWTFLRQLALLFPGALKAYIGYHISVWPESYPFADKPGEPYGYVLTYLDRRIPKKVSPEPIGNFHWAGDFFSPTSPAYMNGAVETGLSAVRAIARKVFPSSQNPE